MSRRGLLAALLAALTLACGMETDFYTEPADDGWLRGCDEDDDYYPDYADCLLI